MLESVFLDEVDGMKHYFYQHCLGSAQDLLPDAGGLSDGRERQTVRWQATSQFSPANRTVTGDSPFLRVVAEAVPALIQCL